LVESQQRQGNLLAALWFLGVLIELEAMLGVEL
jgi:hypothetical protein